MDEFDIREIAGVKGLSDSVRLVEDETRILLTAMERTAANTVPLTPDQARRLARQLHRLARRVDIRINSQ